MLPHGLQFVGGISILGIPFSELVRDANRLLSTPTVGINRVIKSESLLDLALAEIPVSEFG